MRSRETIRKKNEYYWISSDDECLVIDNNKKGMQMNASMLF